MFTIQVLGSGCAKCGKVVEKIQAYINENGVNAVVEKQTSPEALIRYSVMKTPAVVVNEKLVHSSSIPTDAEIDAWLK